MKQGLRVALHVYDPYEKAKAEDPSHENRSIHSGEQPASAQTGEAAATSGGASVSQTLARFSLKQRNHVTHFHKQLVLCPLLKS